MKRIAHQFAYPTGLAVAAAVFLALIVFASAGPSHAAGLVTAGTASKTDRVEARIKDLHTKLKITPAQEGLWDNVTLVMRDNAKTMEALINARKEKASTMNAVDDLRSYGQIAEAHADGLRKFVPVFEPLYAGMSDAQRKDADTLFHQQGRTKAKAKAKAKAKGK